MPRRTALRSLATLGFLIVLLASGCSGDEPAPDDSRAAAETLVQTGLGQLEAGDTSAAQVTFENVLALEPDNQYAHYNLGLIAQGDGDDAEALTRYDAALAADPEFAAALYNKAILTEPDDLDAAVAIYRQVIEIDETFAAAHMRLGFALLHLGETAEAEEALARGIALDPAMADVEAPSYE